MTTPHPRCALCRDATYATMSLQTHDDPEWPWSHYCDPCGAAMASVIRDGHQKRDPVKRRLPDPPAGTKAPDPAPEKKPSKAVKAAPVKEAPKPAPTPAKPAKVVAPPSPAKPTSGGYNLLELMGWKK